MSNILRRLRRDMVRAKGLRPLSARERKRKAVVGNLRKTVVADRRVHEARPKRNLFASAFRTLKHLFVRRQSR